MINQLPRLFDRGSISNISPGKRDAKQGQCHHYLVSVKDALAGHDCHVLLDFFSTDKGAMEEQILTMVKCPCHVSF